MLKYHMGLLNEETLKKSRGLAVSLGCQWADVRHLNFKELDVGFRNSSIFQIVCFEIQFGLHKLVSALPSTKPFMRIGKNVYKVSLVILPLVIICGVRKIFVLISQIIMLSAVFFHSTQSKVSETKAK